MELFNADEREDILDSCILWILSSASLSQAKKRQQSREEKNLMEYEQRTASDNETQVDPLDSAK